MSNKFIPTDKVRASRDGHEFHEAWTARKALQLFLKKNNLVGIAVEGLTPPDQATAASETVDIADIVLYYGKYPTFKSSIKINIVQFKYSVSHKDDDFRASHAKKTIMKFAAAYLDHKKRYNEKEVQDKLRFELITNRPIYPEFKQAVSAIANKKTLKGEIKKQADQFKNTCGFKGKVLIEFTKKFHITGLAGNLNDNKKDLSRTIVNWSAATDIMAQSRLGAMKQLLRDKAGSAGTGNNVIRRVDVLHALDIQDEDELLPCPANIPETGKVIERKQLAEVVSLIPNLNKPLLIHAAGGVGKTVFLKSLATELSKKHEVLLFDCFGGGAYRSPEDSRHLPKRGLIHIINSFACRGLCDPLLPNNDNIVKLYKAFRRRLAQCVDALKMASKEMEIVLFIDAIDNAAVHAKDTGEKSFPTLLLESIKYNGSIPGVKIIVSCRSHRIDESVNGTNYHDFELEPFDITETEEYLRNRIPGITQSQIQIAQARAGGNARILEHLVQSDRGILDQSETSEIIKLDDLLNTRIEDALEEAMSRGHKKAETDAFLAGLSVLPPPVPLNEYADAHGMDSCAVESFAADLAPLLERTKHGLMFRDEPTETLIREKFGSNKKALQLVANNLLNKQDSSVYASCALPGLLQKLDNGKQLFKLAFDTRFPESIKSKVGIQNIRYSRLKAATLHAAKTENYNRLVHLLVELSTISAVDHRGANYILNHPNLVIAVRDVDATRRLFETRTAWPGTRHARLAIANTLSGDIGDANRHAISADEWIFHYRQQDKKRSLNHVAPNRLDIASVPFCLITQNQTKKAIKFLRGWKDWYVYEVGEHLFSLLNQSKKKLDANRLLNDIKDDIGLITSVLSFLDINDNQRNRLIKQLVQACRKEKNLEINDSFNQGSNYRLQDGILEAAAQAVSFGFKKGALDISSHTSHKRPDLWSFRDTYFSHQPILSFLVQIAIESVAKGSALKERDILPQELYQICLQRNTGEGVEFRKKLSDRLEKHYSSKQNQTKEGRKVFRYELKNSAENFIQNKLESLFTLSKSFANMLSKQNKKGDKAFRILLEAWNKTRDKPDQYHSQKYNVFFHKLGLQLIMFTLRTRNDLNTTSIKLFLKELHKHDMKNISILLEMVSILSNRNLPLLAGEIAQRVKSLIEEENDVDYRASLYAQLAEAILPVSKDEAEIYFKLGLEQMDAIGSGDYQFINELLLFASSLKGRELNDQEFHTLTNICELNMSDEEHKFPWFAFATGLSKVSGCKTLAKLSRWDDRSKISFDYTLLPYITALIDDDKIAPEDALALLRLSYPAELWSCNTETLVKTIEQKKYPKQENLINELIKQFENNNPSVHMGSTYKVLADVAEKVLENSPETTTYLLAAHKLFTKSHNELNEQNNYHNKLNKQLSRGVNTEDRKNLHTINKLVKETDPKSEVSLGKAIDKLNSMHAVYDFKEIFFNKLRLKVHFSNRIQYVQNISRLNNLDLHIKLNELKNSKKQWEKSSVSLLPAYKELGTLITQLHSADFVNSDYLSNYKLKEVSNLFDIPIKYLALELIKIFSSRSTYAPAPAWLGLASVISNEADNSESLKALKRLLNSDSARLASNVTDGEWKEGLYPTNNSALIASGLVWRMLGSPYASERWRAAHSIRSFVKLDRWAVIDALVARFNTEDVHPFQAPELPFYYLHARLWLLISLARIAIDDPKRVAKYKKMFMDVIMDDNSPHVLMRHFASQAILVCLDSGNIKLSANHEKIVRNINVSQFPQLKMRLKKAGFNSFYQGRPSNAPKPKFEFNLDYDFEKTDVKGLSDIFGIPSWEVKDKIANVINKIDPKIKSMYETGGRSSGGERLGRMNSKHHSYGQQLGWHALFVVAGQLLNKYPVTEDSWRGDPWNEWLEDNLLTRDDGLWLSDGIDRPPLNVRENLLEQGGQDLAITGIKAKLLNLVNIGSRVGKEIVIDGGWSSPDNIQVHISSALVSKDKADKLSKQLIQEKPFFVWLPTYNQYFDEHNHLERNKKNLIPWVSSPSIEEGIDKDDPLGEYCVVNRPFFGEDIVTEFSLSTNDPFNRFWINKTGKHVAHSDAWGYENKYEKDAPYSGVRLVCSRGLLKKILKKKKSNLLILIRLQRYEEGFGGTESKFTHTVAVVSIDDKLNLKYYKGAINKIHKSKY